VLPYFRLSESWEGGASEYRGGEGPLSTRSSRYADALFDAWVEAGVDAGHPVTDDYNGAQQHGFSRMQSTIRNGRRCSAADAYLRPALRRKNLSVSVHALTTKILFEGYRAVGLEYIRDGKKHVARAEREVLVSGGVINTPQLLMLSGIGDADELRAHGIEVKAPLQSVGKNLQDHVMAPLPFRRREPGPLHRTMRMDRIALELARCYFLGTGFATDLPGPLLAFLKTSPDKPIPDVQLLFHGGPLTAAPYVTASPASWCCCARKAAAASSSPRRIRRSRCASARTSCPATGTGRRCGPACAWRATSRGASTWSASSAPTSPAPTPTSTSAPPPSRCTTRWAPAPWARWWTKR
jgi:choline dehydrogenase-like flavoprotein